MIQASGEEAKFTVEEVDSADQPRRARVDDAETPAEKLGRKRDYLEGFLAEKQQDAAAGEPGGDIYEGVVAALKEIFDPEIPVNIYELGLIYGVDVDNEGGVVITMTLTTPHCPVAESMPSEVELRVGAVPGVRDVEVNLVWDPPWDMGKMSDEAVGQIGLLAQTLENGKTGNGYRPPALADLLRQARARAEHMVRAGDELVAQLAEGRHVRQ